jgi:hypothetical protein
MFSLLGIPFSKNVVLNCFHLPGEIDAISPSFPCLFVQRNINS